ncbi:MAG: 3-phosphoshikimate 1-carboxyvinyltransferase, partial [Gemmatimonadetes bacterium]|nr:3-phosphoshikimate 1-carboxyvinyltransferase [Gemmatimonadota bacterium]
GAGVAVEVWEPRRSRDHSERMLQAMGVEVMEAGVAGGWCVRVPSPPSRLGPLDMDVPGDFSSAAFFLAWAALSGRREPLTVRGVGLNRTRTGLLAVLERMGARLEVVPRETAGGERVGDLTVRARATPLRAVEVGGDRIPGMIDEVPILAVLAARAEGVTRITGAAELRVKESDRLEALATNLRRVGVTADELPDGLEIEGTDRPLSGLVESFHDHRIAMAFGVLGATPGCDARVDDPGVTDVSFPGFWSLLAGLGDRR